VWWYPATYVVHLGEEYFAAGGFPAWVERTLAVPFSNGEFLFWNSFALAGMCTGAWLASRNAKFRFIDIACGVAVLGNVTAHALASVATWTYSPGLVTGLLVWMPLALGRLPVAARASTRRSRIAGVCVGLVVVLVTLVVVGFRAQLRL
jgi:hypothetical protein